MSDTHERTDRQAQIRERLAVNYGGTATIHSRDDIAYMLEQITRYQTAELEQNAVIASLTAQNDALAREVADLRGKITGEREC